MNSSNRHSKSQTPSSSPHTLRRLRSTPRRVYWSNARNDNTNSTNPSEAADIEHVESTRDNDKSPLIISSSNNDEINTSTAMECLSISQLQINSNKENELTTNDSVNPFTNDTPMTLDNISSPVTTAQVNRISSRKTDVLSLFENLENKMGYKCKLCSTILKEQGRSTTNLRRHLGAVHYRTEYLYNSQKKEYKIKQPIINPDFKKKLDDQQVYAIVVDSRSFGDFSRSGMKAFLATAVPGYKPLHRITVRRRIKLLYKSHRQTLKKVLANVPCISLTTDTWSNSRNKHFICLTGHFLDEKFRTTSITLGFRVIHGRHYASTLQKFIASEIEFYGIADKVQSVTSDNASNIVNAISGLHLGSHQSCMGHNLNLLVKSTIFASKAKSSFPSAVQRTTNDRSSLEDKSSSESDDSTSEEEEDANEQQEDGQTTDCSTSEASDCESSSAFEEDSEDLENEKLAEDASLNVVTDPTMVKIRLLIKQARKLINLIRRSSILVEYIQQEKTAKKLPGDGLILDCDIRWNSLYLMLDRFIKYRTVIEYLTILHRSVIDDLPYAMIKKLKDFIFIEEDWNHFIAICNVLAILYKACRLLSGKHYPTLSIVYVITTGLKNALTKPSVGSQADIENTLKKYLYDSFQYHFDQKLSVDQKHATLIAAYLDPSVYHCMDYSDKKLAEQLIIDQINTNVTLQHNNANAISTATQQRTNNSLDQFLIECGLTSSVPTTFTQHRNTLTARDEISFYRNKVLQTDTFQDFWNHYHQDLPRMTELVRSFNVRPATSVASESLFSSASYVQSKHRSSLSPSSLKYSMILRDQATLSEIANLYRVN